MLIVMNWPQSSCINLYIQLVWSISFTFKDFEMTNDPTRTAPIPVDGLLRNVRLATLTAPEDPANPYGEVEDASLVWSDGRLVYVGPSSDCPAIAPTVTLDGQQGWVTPGLIDCHTHLVYGGNRAEEFELLRQGIAYADIARAGGGINSTVRNTRAASADELYHSARIRLLALMAEGVTAVEIKSGYGLDIATELKMLRVIKRLAATLPIHVSATCLAAHALPFDFAGDKDAYISQVIDELLPQVKAEQLATSVDVFCEAIGFSVAQSERLFQAARALGFEIKGHVEQLTQSHGTDLVARYQGLSADHLEYADADQVKQMAAQEVAAVLLPGAFYYLSETQKPPIQALREHRVAMAIATDMNPGSSPLGSLLLAANMSAVFFGLTPVECWAGITRHAAQAIGQAQRGQLRAGFAADFVLWACDHPRQLIHEINTHKPVSVWYQGTERQDD